MELQNLDSWLVTLGGLGAFGAAIATYFRGKSAQDCKINKGFNDQNIIINEIRLKLNTVEIYMNVWRGYIEKELPKLLIKPHRPEIDKYMRKMKEEGIKSFTLEEMEDFIHKMQSVVDGTVPDAESDDTNLKMGYIFTSANVAGEAAVKRHVDHNHKDSAQKEKHDHDYNNNRSSIGEHR